MRRWKGIVAGGGLVLGLFTLAWIGRSLRYAQEGRRLVATAERFPRSYTVPGVPSIPGETLVLGDSTAMGVGVDRLEDTLPYQVVRNWREGARVRNLAVSGARLADVVRDQLPRIPEARYGNVVVCVSANDATHGTGASFSKDFERLLERLERLGPRGHIFVTTTPNFRNTPALPWFLNREFENRGEKLTGRMIAAWHRRKGVIFVDLLREGALRPREHAADGFHPNADGYRRWATIFAAARTRVLRP